MAHLSLEQLVQQIDAASPDAGALRRLSLAVLGSEELASVADELVGHYVVLARSEGASWADIGSAMGVSKQAAQQRHTSRSHDVDELEGLDDAAREALGTARDEATGLRHHYVGTEHVLLGVLRVDSPLAEALGVTPEDALETALALVGRGEVEVRRPPLLTARARKTMDLASLAATERGHDLVTPGDVVLGILREGRGIAARILDQRAGGVEHAREVVLALS